MSQFRMDVNLPPHPPPPFVGLRPVVVVDAVVVVGFPVAVTGVVVSVVVHTVVSLASSG